MAERFDLSAFHYAHRGLWSPEGPPENSLEACLAAADAGYGIEFDVRPAACGTAIVFHDTDLARMTGEQRAVETMTAAEISSLDLIGGGRIPTLDALLAAWPVDTPLLCEMKIDGKTDASAFSETVGDRLMRHAGPIAAMSFDETAVGGLPEGLQRGQLIEPAAMIGVEKRDSKRDRALATGVDYLAVHVSDVIAIADAIGGAIPITTWTVRTVEARNAARQRGVAMIFEMIDPSN